MGLASDTLLKIAISAIKDNWLHSVELDIASSKVNLVKTIVKMFDLLIIYFQAAKAS